jgi:hypothetical protein
MPSALTYPGVYVEEIPSGVRTIIGVGTSIAAFIGRAARGPVNKPIVINSFGDFDRQFGGVWAESTLGYAVRDFFLNGGSQAVIVRLFKPGGNANKEQADKKKDAEERAAEAAGVIVGKVEVLPGIDGLAVETLPVALEGTFTPHKKNGGEEGAVADRLEAEVKRLVGLNGAEPSVETLLAILEGKYVAGNGVEAKAQNEVVKAAIKAGKEGGAQLIDITRAARNAVPSDKSKPVQTAATGKADEIAIAATTKATMTPALVLLGLKAAIPEIARGVADLMVPTAKEAVLKGEGLTLKAVNSGMWGNKLRFRIDYDVDEQAAKDNGYASKDELFNLTVHDLQSKTTEVFRNVAINGSRELKQVLATSQLVQCDQTLDTRPVAHELGEFSETDEKFKFSTGVTTPASDGEPLNDDTVLGTDEGGEGAKKGLYALEDVDLFNLLCIPPYSRPGNEAKQPENAVLGAAARYCQRRRAMLIVDPPLKATKEDMRDRVSVSVRAAVGDYKANTALFYPSLRAMSSTGRLEDFAPCGAIAGTFARTDTTRGVWKAPAGIEAGITGASGLTTALTDGENGELNPRAINCLRNLPAGRVIWGSRTLAGDDRTPNDWKYIPVRRTALYIEESLYRGTQWVVFEPNDEPLWAQIRLSVGAFMNDLFRQRAFQGQTPREAYFVKCGKETNPQNDIDKGIVNILVGFAPLKPAEFVVIKLQQIAGEILT